MKKLMTAVIVLLSNVAFAEEVTNVVATTATGPSDKIYYGIAAAFAIAFATLGGALGQAKVASAAMEGIGRNPNAKDSMQTPMILGLVFIETVVLLGFVVAFSVLGLAS